MYCSYRNYKGGINNLCVAVADNGVVGTSTINMNQAITNCKRNGGK